MRIRHLLTSAVPVMVMLLTSLSAQAQYGMPSPSVGPAYFNGSPGSSGVAPSQFRPSPGISPFDHMFDQTYNSNGMWFRNQTNGFGPFNHPRKWSFNVDYTRTKTRKLAGYIGADNVQTYLQQNDPENDGVVTDDSFYPYFDAAPASIIPQLTNSGIRLSGGFDNIDGSGFMFRAGWMAERTGTFNARAAEQAKRVALADTLRMNRTGFREDRSGFNLNGLDDLFITETYLLAPGTVFDTAGNQIFARAPSFGTTFDILDRTVMNLYGLPIQYGFNNLSPQQGSTVPFDLQYLVEHRLQTLYADGDWAFAPILDRRGLTVRPIVGARYTYIDEGFGFRGASTLLSYAGNGDNDTPITGKVFPVKNGVDEDGDGIPDNPDEEAATTFVAPIGVDGLVAYSHLNADVRTHLAGPQIGMQYEVGDRSGVRISGATRLGAFANNETITVSGDNIGDFIGVEVTPDPITGANIATDMFDTNIANGPTLNAFRDTRRSTHISPMFEQTFNADIPLFRNVPVLKDMWQLDDAKLNLGWTFVAIGEVADPQESVNWTSSPIFGITPTARPERHTFYQNTFNIGINWNY